MSKLDRLKEEISYQKYFLSIALTVAIGLLGWLGLNLPSAETYQVLIASLIVVFSFFFAYTRHRTICLLLEELENA